MQQVQRSDTAVRVPRRPRNTRGPAMTVQVGHRTDIGRRRKQNQDTYRLPPFERQDLVQAYGELYIVADGMGGHAAGADAANIVADTMMQQFYALGNAEIPDKLRKSIRVAANAVIREASQHPEKADMGTTVVAAVRKNDRVWFANVGDSRGYIIREESIEQVTRDHTIVDEMVRQGTLTPEQAQRHKLHGVLSRAIAGGNPPPEPDIYGPFVLQPGDVVLLCSDGLSNLVQPQEMHQIVRRSKNLQAAADQLVALANQRGGPDNITAVLFNYGPAARAGRRGISFSPLLMTMAGGVLAFLLIALGMWLYSNSGSGGKTASASPTVDSTGVAASEAQSPTLTPSPQMSNNQNIASLSPTLSSSSSQEPAATITPTTSVSHTAKVIVSKLNVRSGPGTVYEPPIDFVLEGDRLILLGWGLDVRDPKRIWLKVRTPRGIEGWVAKEARDCSTDEQTVKPCVDVDDSIVHGLPVMLAPSTPTPTPTPMLNLIFQTPTPAPPTPTPVLPTPTPVPPTPTPPNQQIPTPTPAPPTPTPVPPTPTPVPPTPTPVPPTPTPVPPTPTPTSS